MLQKVIKRLKNFYIVFLSINQNNMIKIINSFYHFILYEIIYFNIF